MDKKIMYEGSAAVGDLFFYDCIWDDDIIFSCAERNGIGRMKMNGEAELMAKIPNVENARTLFPHMFRDNNILYLFPSRAPKLEIVLYDVVEKRFDKLKLEPEIEKYLCFNSARTVRVGDDLYCVQLNTIILKINLKEKYVNYLYLPDADPEQDYIPCVHEEDGKIFIPFRNKNKLLVLNTNADTFEEIFINRAIGGISTITGEDSKIWITGKFKGIIEYDFKTKICLNYKNLPDDFGVVSNEFCTFTEEYFGASIFINGKVYFFPGYANMILILNIDNKKIERLLIPDEEECEASLYNAYRFSTTKYVSVKKKKHEILFMSYKKQCVYILNTQTNTVNTIYPKWKKEVSFPKRQYTLNGFIINLIENKF